MNNQMTFDHIHCTVMVLAVVWLSVAGAMAFAARWVTAAADWADGRTSQCQRVHPDLRRSLSWLLLWVVWAAPLLGCRSRTTSEPQEATLMQLGQAIESRQIDQLVSALNPTDREQLRQRKQQFDSLEAEQQQKLRETHQRICGSGRRDVYVTLHRYCEWLATLPDGERADLLELSAAERIEKIRQRQRDADFTPMDVVRAVVEWLSQYVQQHEPELYRQLPDEVRERLRDRLDRMPKTRDKFRTFMLLREVTRWRDRIQFPPAGRAEIEQLISQLPETSVTHLSTRIDFSNPALVPRQLLEMMDTNMRRRFHALDESRLKQFYESDALTTQQRDQLDRLPPEEARLQLQEMMVLARMDELQRGDWRRGLERRPRGNGPYGRRGRPPLGPGGPPNGPRPFPPPELPPDQQEPPPPGEPRRP